MISIRSGHELCRDAQTVVDSSHAALENGAHLELVSDNAQVDMFTFKGESRAARDNAQSLNLSQRIDDLKGRLDRGEGKTSVSDPETTAALARLGDINTRLTEKISSLSESRSEHKGSERTAEAAANKNLITMGIVVAFIVGAGQVLAHVFH